jgi:hypothetical protein
VVHLSDAHPHECGHDPACEGDDAGSEDPQGDQGQRHVAGELF